MPEHNVITDPELHEPKGASTASSGEAYVSDGAGSGVWTPVNITGEFARSHYHSMTIRGNASTQPIPLAVDSALDTNSDYVKWTTGWQNGPNFGSNWQYDSDRLTLLEDSTTYLIDAQFLLQPVSGSGTGKKIALRRSTTNTTGGITGFKVVAELGGTDEIVQMRLLDATPIQTLGASVSFWFASEEAVNLRVIDAHIRVDRV